MKQKEKADNQLQGEQLGLWQIHLHECHFTDLLEKNDNHCFSFDPKQNNEVLSCDNPKTYKFLAHIRNVNFDVVAKPTPNFLLPSFIPIIPHGSQKILIGNDLPYVAATLSEIVSPKKLCVAEDIRRRLGINKKSKIIFLSYGHDKLIEKIWPDRYAILEKIANLDLLLITAINYSVWLKDPHAERLINLKRSLITFEDMQNLEMPAIPHIYWTGKKDLIRWNSWLSKYSTIKIIAINLQTERGGTWTQTLKDLSFFISILEHPIHFLITGPSIPSRVRQIKNVLSLFTLSNGLCANKASSGYLIKEKYDKIYYERSELPKNIIFHKNIEFYEKILVD